MASKSTIEIPKRPEERRRRTQEERSNETRLKLLNATVDLLIERGYSKLTVDDVSSRAGVTNGARAHHYTTKLDLMVETFKHLQGPVQAIAREAADNARVSEDPLGAFVDHSISIFLARDAVAFNELLVGARTDAALRDRIAPLIDIQHEDIHRPWADVLIGKGYPADQVRSTMAATMYFMRGIVTDPLVDVHDRAIRELLDFWHDTVATKCLPPPNAKGKVVASTRLEASDTVTKTARPKRRRSG